MTYIVGASIRLHSLQVLVDQWRRFRRSPKSRSRYWRTFSRQLRPVCCKSPRRLRHVFEGCSLGATRANPAFGKPNTFTHILKAKVPPVRGSISGRGRNANPAFGKPITFTDSQGNIAIRLSAVLWARDVQTQPSGSRTPHSHLSRQPRPACSDCLYNSVTFIQRRISLRTSRQLPPVCS